MERDYKGNIISVADYNDYFDIKTNISVPNKLEIIDSSSLSKLINLDFEELIENTNLNNNNINSIPEGTLIISESDYENLQNKLLNLEEELISTSSYYESEIEIIKSENTALLRTIESINSGALTISNLLLEKYRNNINVYNDLLSYKTLWSTPFSDLITKTGSLSTFTRSFNDYSMSVVINYNNYPPTISNINFISNTIVSYSLAFDGNYLINLFESASNNLILLNEIEQLKLENNKLKNENSNLWRIVLEEGVYQFNQSEYSDLLLKVSFNTTSSFYNFGGFYINIKNLSKYNPFEYNYGPFNPSISNLVFEQTLRIPPGKIKFTFSNQPIISITPDGPISGTGGGGNSGGNSGGGNSGIIYITTYNNGIIKDYNNLNGFEFLVYPFKTISQVGIDLIDKIDIKLY